MLGFPIQTPRSQRLLGNSSKIFAAYHVFHRLAAPRNPPCALNSLIKTIIISYNTNIAGNNNVITYIGLFMFYAVVKVHNYCVEFPQHKILTSKYLRSILC